MIVGRKAEISAPAPLRSYGRRKAKPLSARKERLIGEFGPGETRTLAFGSDVPVVTPSV